jgi:hypothetical protein
MLIAADLDSTFAPRLTDRAASNLGGLTTTRTFSAAGNHLTLDGSFDPRKYNGQIEYDGWMDEISRAVQVIDAFAAKTDALLKRQADNIKRTQS